MSHEFIELYINDQIAKLIEEKVQSLTRVNRRLYKNKFVIYCFPNIVETAAPPGDYNKNGAKLRTHVDAERLKMDPAAAIGTLVWYLSSKGGKVTDMLRTLKAWGIIEPKRNMKSV